MQQRVNLVATAGELSRKPWGSRRAAVALEACKIRLFSSSTAPQRVNLAISKDLHIQTLLQLCSVAYLLLCREFANALPAKFTRCAAVLWRKPMLLFSYLETAGELTTKFSRCTQVQPLYLRSNTAGTSRHIVEQTANHGRSA